MVNNRFEVYKLKREIKRSGKEYQFVRWTPNEFGEPSGESTILGTINGLYHETSEHIIVSMGDTTQVRTKKVPSIICPYEEYASLFLVAGDEVLINGKRMKVTGIVDIQEWQLIADISLEVVDGGV